MKAFKQGITKAEFVRELKAHQKADAFLRGTYGNTADPDFRGCAVGCSLESVGRLKGLEIDVWNHSLYPVHLGIPEWLARLEDTIFEGVPAKRSKTWPVEFAQAVRPGADLEKARVPFLLVVLKHSIKSVQETKFNRKENPGVVKALADSESAVKQMMKALKSGKGIMEAREAAAKSAESAAYAAESAAYAARSAAYAAKSAAWSAADAAESAARSAADAAESAAYAAARSAAYAAESAESAADAAARSAADAAARSAAAAAFDFYADELLKILKNTK